MVLVMTLWLEGNLQLFQIGTQTLLNMESHVHSCLNMHIDKPVHIYLLMPFSVSVIIKSFVYLVVVYFVAKLIQSCIYNLLFVY